MCDPTADVALSAVESSLYNTVNALLKEMNSRSASQKGMLRWSLQKKLEGDPSCSVSLIRVLVEELDKKLNTTDTIHKTRSYMHIIPVLHTLYYVIIQSDVMIPTSLYQKVNESLMKLLILPSPYSSVALSTLRSIKMEMATPGSLYQRRIIAEQNLKNEHFTIQEEVFVLADPAVFSAPLEAKVRAHLEVSSTLRNASTVKKNVVLHMLQTGLGTTSQSSRLAQALEALGHQVVEKYFQEVVLLVEQSIKHGTDGRANYLNKLQHIYRDILTASKEEITRVDDGPSVRGTALPFPKINFLLWKDKEDLSNLLINFARRCYPDSSVDEEDKRDSVRSEDSGIERDQKECGFDDKDRQLVRNSALAVSRRNALKSTKSGHRRRLVSKRTEEFSRKSPAVEEDKRRHTARIAVMGDDRVLGILTNAYHSIRESKRLIMTKKLNLQFYYIPVTDVLPMLRSPDSPCQNDGRLSLASYLGRVDPWYNSTVNGLGAAIPKLAEPHSHHRQPSMQNLFLLDTLCYYLRCGTQPVNLPLYSVKMTCSSCDGRAVVKEVFVSHLEADIPDFRHLKESSLRKPSSRRRTSAVEVFGAVISVSYTKISLSKREVVKGEAPMTCGVVITSEPAAVTSGENYLTVRFNSLNPVFNTEIQTQNISFRTIEQRTLSVCLDKDIRRTYTDVRRVEISPCLDPGCSIQSWFDVSSEGGLPLSRYLDKDLSLPINTFSGVTL
ncbi:phosphoinositide 3-kinase regulatory subunit 6 [Micropterus salmoides]|uniref:phosphoinositide 3-kinase regulatory subunit 6 n=1 Tax=Micropterus salmoides TaxID=27706 RepID=UPI0018ED13C3|nr:phosphoinositide 3-kinase regulatory subunit 6 [Micropterus salmoides]